MQTEINWDISRTDVPIFDTSILDCTNPKRNYDVDFKWIPTQEFLEWQYKILDIAHKEYGIKKTGKEGFYLALTRRGVERVKHRLRNGRKLHAFVIEFDKNKNLLSFQEGRHRIIALKEMGVETVPVYFMYKRY